MYLLQAAGQNASDIIKAAAQSPLGVASLIILALSVIAYFFFKDAPNNVKAGMYALMFCGLLGFGVTVFLVSPKDDTRQLIGQGEPASNRTAPAIPSDKETKCIEEKTKEIAQKPMYAAAIWERGGCYERRNRGDDLTKAIDDYTKVIEIFGDNAADQADVFQNRGNAYQKRHEGDDLKDAIKDYTMALELCAQKKCGDANRLDLLKDRGYAYEEAGKPNLRIEDFKTICREDAASPQCNIVKSDIPKG